MFFRKTNILFLTDELLLLRVDIGVIEEDGVINARGLNGLHYLAGAGRAAGVQQQFVSAVWQGKLRTNEGGCAHGIQQYVNEIYGIVA